MEQGRATFPCSILFYKKWGQRFSVLFLKGILYYCHGDGSFEKGIGVYN